MDHLKIKLNQYYTEPQIFESYVREYFRLECAKEGTTAIDAKSDLFGKYNDIIHGSILKKYYYEELVLLGQKADGLMEFLTESRVYEIKESKRLAFTGKNKYVFSEGQDVQLELEIKNIQHVVLNLYELNTENCYRSNLAEIDKEI